MGLLTNTNSSGLLVVVGGGAVVVVVVVLGTEFASTPLSPWRKSPSLGFNMSVISSNTVFSLSVARSWPAEPLALEFDATTKKAD